MRGEQLLMVFQTLLRMGSPPHARGAVSGLFQQVVSAGITPACAGSRTPTQVARG